MATTQAGHTNLWITDGTSAGTTELALAVSPVEDGFSVVANNVLFEHARPFSIENGLWITDGTSAGTSEVAVPGAWSGGGGLSPTDITAFLPPPTPVIIATNGATSLVQVGSQYELEAVSSGTGPLFKYGGSTVTVGEFPGWTPVGAAKTATGYEVAWSLGANEYSVWNTNNNGAYTDAATGALSGASYALQKLETSFGEDLNGDGTIGPTLAGPPAAPHDFNNDGLSDILWQNFASGQAAIWEMSGSNVIAGGVVSPNPGPSWKEIGTGDFNDDGLSDILWQNANGQAAIWDMNGTSIIGGGTVSANPGPSWKAIGTGDFNGDGHSDILWQNANGQAAIWDMNGNNDHRRRDGQRQSRAELESDRNRRLQRRRPFRHPVAERQWAGRDLGHEREQDHRRRDGERQSRAELEADRIRRLQPRRSFRHPVAEHRAAARSRSGR